MLNITPSWVYFNFGQYSIDTALQSNIQDQHQNIFFYSILKAYDMTKAQSYNEMYNSKKVTHKTFLPGEYLYMKDGRIFTEDNFDYTTTWAKLIGDFFTGWEIYPDQVPTTETTPPAPKMYFVKFSFNYQRHTVNCKGETQSFVNYIFDTSKTDAENFSKFTYHLINYINKEVYPIPYNVKIISMVHIPT